MDDQYSGHEEDVGEVKKASDILTSSKANFVGFHGGAVKGHVRDPELKEGPTGEGANVMGESAVEAGPDIGN